MSIIFMGTLVLVVIITYHFRSLSNFHVLSLFAATCTQKYSLSSLGSCAKMMLVFVLVIPNLPNGPFIINKLLRIGVQ